MLKKNPVFDSHIMPTASPVVVTAYTALLERAILNLRLRLRYGEEVSLAEVHDFMDALHNIPFMLQHYGAWHVEENIDRDLSRYDEKWLSRADSERRISLIETLKRAQNGEFPICENEA